MKRYDPDAARRRQLHEATVEHYQDPDLYDHEYRRRRADVNYYRSLAAATGRDVLELGSGSGRLLIPLLRDGARAVGLDYSQPMLHRCQDRTLRLRPAVRARATLVRGDFRRFAFGRRFPLIVCPFNAMMHLYTLDDVASFLACVRAHLTPDGLFAFDVQNPDLHWLTRDPDRRWSRTRCKDPRTGRSYIYTTNHTYDAATQIAWIRIFYDPEGPPPEGRAQRSRIVHLAHRQFFPEELRALLTSAGFALEARDGGFSGEPFESESDAQVVRCRVG
ncbi:MAG: class I SAM-dependent methyltransferase [Myxococcales bacterium]|nr:class I SAM-dependent methyltransferase [Myxococcales bacterium]